MRYVTSVKGDLVVIARSGEVTIHDDNGRERERHKVPYGATLQVKDGDAVKAGKVLATWDATARPIITEYAGRVKFENVEEGVTVAKQVDDVTGLYDPRGHRSEAPRARATAKGVRPQVKLLDDNGEEIKLAGSDLPVNITFQLGSIITVKDGQQVAVGEVLARIPQETSKTRDITGGLPRVAELFEARSPKDAGMLAEVTGTVSFGKDTKGKQRLVITDLDGVAHEYLIPKDKHVTAHDGQVVNKGETIVDGPADPHDILRLLGVEALARYITDEVQDVYRLQGVKINDKHIEVIVRQMLRRVVITEPGDTRFIREEAGRAFGAAGRERSRRSRTARSRRSSTTCCSASPRPRLSTDSFISAASFQETTRVLTEAAIMGKKDDLRGLKENVIVGRLIPAGTGLAYHTARKKAKHGRHRGGGSCVHDGRRAGRGGGDVVGGLGERRVIRTHCRRLGRAGCAAGPFFAGSGAHAAATDPPRRARRASLRRPQPLSRRTRRMQAAEGRRVAGPLDRPAHGGRRRDQRQEDRHRARHRRLASLLFRAAARRLDLPLTEARGQRIYGVGGETKVEIATVDEFKLGEAPVRGLHFASLASAIRAKGSTCCWARTSCATSTSSSTSPTTSCACGSRRTAAACRLPTGRRTLPARSTIEPVTDMQRKIAFTVRLNDKPVQAILDSGASSSIVSMQDAEAVGGVVGSAASRSTGFGGKAVDTRVGMFATLRSATRAFPDVAIRVADIFKDAVRTSTGSAIAKNVFKGQPMLLGADFLRAHRTLVAHSQRKLYFTYVGGPVFATGSAPR